MVDPALDALLRALKTGPPCEHCGRSDADRDPVVLRAAQLVLDRAGYHPTLAIANAAPAPTEYDSLSDDDAIALFEQKIARAQQALDTLKRNRDHRWSLPESTEGFVVPEEEDAIQDADVRIPVGNPTADESKAEMNEIAKENGDE